MVEVKEMLIFPECLEQAEIPYMATGSIASVIYGEPRMTYDIDLVVQLQFYEEGGSEKHIRDIKSMLQISGEDVDPQVLQDKPAEYRLTGIWQELF